MTKKDQIKNHLTRSGFIVEDDARMNNNAGDVLRLSNKCIINVYDTGKVNFQGQNQESVKKSLETLIEKDTKLAGKNIFVVYGHDRIARDQLEAMLRRWELNPIILDQLTPDGNTIIEQLEKNISKCSSGIVLATPDDVGYPKDDESRKKFRVRQNVLLELGMLMRD